MLSNKQTKGNTESFLTNTSTDESTTIELSSTSETPEYVLIYDSSMNLLEEFESKMELIKQLSSERVRDTFGSNKSVEHRLEQSNNQALDLIKRCETNLGSFQNYFTG